MEYGLKDMAFHPRYRVWGTVAPLGERARVVQDQTGLVAQVFILAMTHPFRGVTLWLGGAKLPIQQSRQNRRSLRMDCWNPTNPIGSMGSHGPTLGCPLTIHLTWLEAAVGGGLGSTWLPHSWGQVTNLADLSLCSLCREGVRAYSVAVSEQR